MHSADLKFTKFFCSTGKECRWLRHLPLVDSRISSRDISDQSQKLS